MATEAPAYQMAYEKDGKPICPECGYDFTGQKGASVEAHAADHWFSESLRYGSDEAKARKAILDRIAKELG